MVAGGCHPSVDPKTHTPFICDFTVQSFRVPLCEAGKRRAWRFAYGEASAGGAGINAHDVKERLHSTMLIGYVFRNLHDFGQSAALNFLSCKRSDLIR